MQFFPEFSTFVKIGSFSLRWYPILLCTGGILVYLFSIRNLKKNGYPDEIGDDLFIGCTLAGVAGARLWYVVFYDLQGYLADPIRILYTWEGGLAIQGCIAGASIFVYFYCRKKHYSFLRVLDCIFPVILIGQALGRWGNFFNQEAFGRVVEASFYKNWPAFIADHMYIRGAYREPTFLYESVFNIIGFILINSVYKKFSKPKRGDMVYAYLMWYGVTRTIVESMRTDSLMLGPIRMAQLTGMTFCVVGIFGMLGFFRKKAEKPVLVFDFDQTLGNTAPIIFLTFKHMFEKHLPEYNFTEADMKTVLGPTLKQSFEHYHFPGNPDDLVEEYRQVNRALHTPEYLKPMPGALELLKELKSQGYKIGIFSNKLTDAVELGANVTGLSPYIDVIVGSEQAPAPKPDPSGIHIATVKLGGNYDNCIYVGDVANDVIAGQNAGAYAIAYNIDPALVEEMKEKAHPNFATNDLMDILEVLKEDHAWTTNMN